MTLKSKNCIVGQSGGPTVAINASLSGVLQGILESNHYDTVYGMVNGIEGLLQGKYLNLSQRFDSIEKCHLLTHTPAMYLGSCRFKLPTCEHSEELYEELFNFFEEKEIGTVFYIGGNDSMDTVLKLSHYAKTTNKAVNIIGIPKTIDNDLPVTDHTPGFGSAAKFIATSLLEIAHDTYIYNIPSVTIVEIMGRNAGWLTAASALARTSYSPAPDLIYLPEVAFDKEQFLEDLKALLKVRKNIIVALSEGIKDLEGHYLSASSNAVDAFGHKQLCGVGKTLENLVKAELGCKVRSIELNVLQRAATHCSSLTDLEEAVAIGKYAVTLGAQGETAQMVCYHRISDAPYEIAFKGHPISEIANLEKTVPPHWITEAGNDITAECLNYLLPLVQGEPTIPYKKGIPLYASIDHLHTKGYFKKN
ncbi:6-phosphofructokinase [Sporanaerobium hydrogeniformans]|uniref:6-phosphofructokinase n=1 Tax=Sporanaerobium hydrogeniformans TaxID=3072179 RepID=A0AC61DFY9_9FIRM|nr:6-phosphofructokinase [Sporanaerobium hydrogeniformans]PHV71601.1 6-phosphofructokinase [Sporanaerobium hydrogeniformans]